LPHDDNRQVNVLYTTQNIRQEIAFFECSRISSIRGLIVGCAIDIVEDGSWKTPSRQFPEIVIIEAMV
jgi:hypothetical protein